MKLLLVEDERITREGIVSEVDWSRFGIDLVLEAANGVKACEIAQDIEPDILLTDIHMPQMDGIALAERFRRDFPRCQVAFLSSYGDRETYKAALRLGVVGFIDKPVEWDEFNQIVGKAAMMAVGAHRDGPDPHQGDDAIALMEGTAFLQRLAAGLELPEGLGKALGDMGLPTQGLRFLLCNHPRGHGIPPMLSSMVPALTHTLRTAAGAFVVPMLFQEGAAFLGQATCQLDAGKLGEISGQIAAEFGVPGPYFAWSAETGATGLAGAFADARQTLSKHFFCPDTLVLTPSDRGKQVFIPDKAFDREGRDYMTRMDREGCAEFFRRLAENLRACPDTEPKKARDLFFTYIIRLVKGAYGPDSQQVLSLEQRAIWGEILDIDNIDEMVDYTLNMLDEVAHYAVGNREQHLVNRINHYFAENYASDVNIKTVAELLHFSYSHLCYLYKKVMGVTMRQYLVNLRIEKACELLVADRNLKVMEVAERVGYHDPDYFTQTFRLAMGMTPGEFRERL